MLQVFTSHCNFPYLEQHFHFLCNLVMRCSAILSHFPHQQLTKITSSKFSHCERSWTSFGSTRMFPSPSTFYVFFLFCFLSFFLFILTTWSSSKLQKKESKTLNFLWTNYDIIFTQISHFHIFHYITLHIFIFHLSTGDVHNFHNKLHDKS